MMETTSNKLFQLLADALDQRDGYDPTVPVTVAEIYQELVPYREVRERLGVELNADYEHALLRLLAGEDGLLRLEPSSARDELRQELASPNPYVGLYRKFAACDVWIEGGDRAGQSTRPEPEAAAEPVDLVASTADPEASAPRVAMTDGPVTAMPRPLAAARPATAAATGSKPAPPISSGKCPFCAKPIPVGRNVRFCPHCGADQNERPCAKCGEVLEREWRYCISCGTAAPAT